MSLPRFKDVAKGINNLLTKEGWDLKYGAKVEGKSSDVKITAEWENAGTKTKGALTGEIVRDTPMDTTTTVSASIDTTGTGKGSVTVKGLAAGLDVLGGYSRSSDKKSATVGARYRNSNVDGEAVIDVVGCSHDIEAAVTAGQSGFFVGAKATMSTVMPEKKEEKAAAGSTDADAASDEKKESKFTDRFTSYDFVAGYTEKDLEFAITTEKKLDVVNAGFVYKLTQSTDIGAALKFQRGALKKKEDVKEGESAREAATYGFVVGAAFRDDGSTSKVKVDTDGYLHGSYTAPMRGGAVLTVVGRVNVTKKDDAGFGLQVALK